MSLEAAVHNSEVMVGIAFEAPDPVRAALEAAGRTEDVRVSPDGRRLALACYSENAIGLAEIEIERAAAAARIAVTDFELLRGSGLHEPHGVDFVTDDVVVVANRGGTVAFFALPERGSCGELVPWGDPAGAPDERDGPGSVLVRAEEDGDSLLVCNNWVHTVTRHALAPDGVLSSGEIVAERRLELPDGLALSADGRWLAVSSHDSSVVLVYAYPSREDFEEPVCMLRGVRCPHGLRFASDGRRLFVADAGAPYVHVFETVAGGWTGVAYPVRSIRVLDDDAFARGRHNRYEGGPKGIDVLDGDDVLVVTCDGTPVAFFDLLRANDPVTTDLRLQYELNVLDAHDETKETVADLRRELDAFRGTRAWKIIEPARETYAKVRRLRSR